MGSWGWRCRSNQGGLESPVDVMGDEGGSVYGVMEFFVGGLCFVRGGRAWRFFYAGVRVLRFGFGFWHGGLR